MKAKERIKRYGVEKYIRTCLHKEPTPELIEKYKKKYGDWIPTKQPTRYQVTQWDVVMENEETGEIKELKGLSSKLHREADNDRDIAEVERKAQGKLGGSEWHIIDAEYRGKKYYWLKDEKLESEPVKRKGQKGKVKGEKRAKKEVKKKEVKKKEIIPKEQIKEIVEGMKMAGMTPEEIGRALKEMMK